MGIASGAFIGPAPNRQMTSAQAGELTHTHGAVDELRRGIPSAYLTIVLLLVLAVIVFALRRNRRRNRSGSLP